MTLDPATHITQITVESKIINELRAVLTNPDYKHYSLCQRFAAPSHSIPLGRTHGWLSDECLRRFLVANDLKVLPAAAQLAVSLQWKLDRKPHLTRAAEMETEAKTGKVRIGGKDRFGRPVLVLDNSKENTWNPVENMKFLAWNLERVTLITYLITL